MQHFFVINPHSFRTLDSLKKILMDLENCFSVRRRMEYKIYVSRHPRDAIAAVHRYLLTIPYDRTARVYAVGGDGILFDCLNGMINFPNAELTSVPYGSANDFVRAFGEKAKETFRDIKKLSVAPSRPVDVIHCGSNYALNVTDIGMIGQTIIYANRILRNKDIKLPRRLVPLIYNMSGIRAMMDGEIIKQRYRVVMDGEDLSGDYANIAISNGPCFGGNMIPCPNAKPDNGILEVTFAHACGKSEIMRVIGDYNKGLYERHKLFTRRQCRSIEIKSDMPLSVQFDGEGFFTQEIKSELVPGGVKFFVPEELDFVDYSHILI